MMTMMTTPQMTRRTLTTTRRVRFGEEIWRIEVLSFLSLFLLSIFCEHGRLHQRDDRGLDWNRQRRPRRIEQYQVAIAGMSICTGFCSA